MQMLSDYHMSAIEDGYRFECACGELFNCVAAASTCRKCRNYCVFGYCTHVVDICKDEVVAGTVPSEEEYQVARAAAEARWEEEKAEYAFQMAMYAQEGELFEAEMARQAEVAAAVAIEEMYLNQYAIQDELMGY